MARSEGALSREHPLAYAQIGDIIAFGFAINFIVAH